jgi:methionine-rich copper-binding protein CopC
VAVLVAAGLWTGVAVADPLHVRESTPAAEAIIHGRHAEYAIRFDGPVDHAASRIDIVQSGRVIQSLAPLIDSAPEVLFASGETPAPGRYVLRWHARSPAGGDVSNGDIPFSVAP